jgi:hypothetical protein
MQLKALFDLDDVLFIAGRPFKLKGEQIDKGDVIDPEVLKSIRTGEALIRSRRVIPITDDISHAPRAFARVIKDRELTYKKLKMTPPAETQFDPSDHTIPEVQEYLEGKDLAEHERVLAAEEAGENRVTLVTWLNAQIDELLEA